MNEFHNLGGQKVTIDGVTADLSNYMYGFNDKTSSAKVTEPANGYSTSIGTMVIPPSSSQKFTLQHYLGANKITC